VVASEKLTEEQANRLYAETLPSDTPALSRTGTTAISTPAKPIIWQPVFGLVRNIGSKY
jgi:hypothetical protein